MIYNKNSIKNLKCWIKKATKEIKDPATKNILRTQGYILINNGNLRGNISEHWLNNFPALKDQLKDLYL